MPATKTAKKPQTMAPKRAAKAPAKRMTFTEIMRELEAAGSVQTRKTYARHGVTGPMFGASFATLKVLYKRIGVDHELACALWKTGNFDAQNLAMKIADPARFSAADLDCWARETSMALMCGSYVGVIASEGPHALAKAAEWLASEDLSMRAVGWSLFGQIANRDTTIPDKWFLDRLAAIEREIHAASNSEREAMNRAVIVIGCRNAALRRAAIAAAKRIGKVDVDHGDTACKTPDAAAYIEKTWAHSVSKGFESPAAHERTRESPRLRC